MKSSPSAEEADYALTDFLHAYIDIADSKDITAGARHLSGMTVMFPHTQADDDSSLVDLLTELWSDPTPHRHDTSNIAVRRVEDSWVLSAHYTRWILPPTGSPRIVTLGSYLLRATQDLVPRKLDVHRAWSDS